MRGCKGGRFRFLIPFLAATLAAAAAGEASAATLAWTKTYNGAANGMDGATGVAVAKDGSVYVAGFVRTATQGENLLVRKYSPAGGCLWSRTYNGPANGNDRGTGVAVGPDGNVCVVGHTQGAGSASDVFLRKYSPSGATLWTQTYDHAGASSDNGYGVAVARDGSVYAAGSTRHATESYNVLLLKYTSGGAPVWSRAWNSVGNGDEEANGVAVSANGYVYVTGLTRSGASASSLLLCKYGAAGNLVWTRTYSGATTGDEAGIGVAVDTKGAVYVTGYTATASQADNLVLRKYAATGTVLWTRFYDDPAHSYDAGNGVAVAGDGSVVVAGRTMKNGSNTDLLLLRYSAAGVRLSTNTWDGASHTYDEGYGVAAGTGSVVYVVGFTEAGAQGINLLLQKYR